MSEIVNKLRDRRQNVWEQAKALADSVAEENRAFNGEEEGQWQTLNSELDALDKRIKNVLDGEQRAKDTEEAFAKIEGKPQERQDASKTSSELRAFLRGEGGRTFDVKSDGPTDFRTLSKGTAGAGLNTVPTSFYNRLVAHLIEVSGVLQAGPTVLNTSGGETIQIPKTTSHSSATSEQAEAVAINASDPVFGQEELGAYKYATLIQVSRELLDDTGVDLEGYLAMQAGRAIGNALGVRLVLGDGSSKPAGVATRSSLGVTGPASVAGGFGAQQTADRGADVLIDLFYSVISPYRSSQSCGWLMRDATAGVIRKIKDADGQYIWSPSIIPGTPDTLLSKPVFTDPNVAAIGLGNRSVIFGDFSQFFVRMAGPIRFERSDDFAFSSDLVTFRAILRADSELVDQTGAIKHFIGNAA